MKKLLFFLIIISNVVYLLSQEHAGIKIAIKEEVVDNLERKYLPLLMKKLDKIILPNTTQAIDVGVATLHMDMWNIMVSVENLHEDRVEFSFQEPDRLLLQAHNVTGYSRMDVKFKMGFISEIGFIYVTINKLDLDITTTLSQIESAKVKGKYIPSSYISDMVVALDFDLEFLGSVFAIITEYGLKGKIKNYIQAEINKSIKAVIMEQSKKIIADYVDDLPVYLPIGDSGFAIDYSLLSPPKVGKGFLILNTQGSIVNLNNKETLNPPFPAPITLPEFDPKGKSVQMFISDFAINTALNSLFLSGMLNYSLKAEDIPAESPVQLDTTSLNALTPGIQKIYGKDKKADIAVKVVQKPQVWFDKDKIDFKMTAEMSLLVRGQGKSEEALKVKMTVTLGGDLEAEAEGKVHSRLDSILVSDSSLISSKVPGVNVEHMEVIFNFLARVAIPIANKKFLNVIKFSIPTVHGITLNNSEIDIHDDYVELNVSPLFDHQKIVARYISLLEQDIENDIQDTNASLLFLA